MIGTALHNEKIKPASDSRVCEANFYALPFISQMVLWAVRRRLVEAHHNRPFLSDVLPVFHMAGWADLYESLLMVAELMLKDDSPGVLVLHDIGCHHIASHEAYLLNALAHLQNDQKVESALCLCQHLSPSSARLALPALKKIVDKARSNEFVFVYIDITTLKLEEIDMRSPDRLN
mgnify:CR=1 FL=1